MTKRLALVTTNIGKSPSIGTWDGNCGLSKRCTGERTGARDLRWDVSVHAVFPGGICQDLVIRQQSLSFSQIRGILVVAQKKLVCQLCNQSAKTGFISIHDVQRSET
jgi:hypothetical protein